MSTNKAFRSRRGQVNIRLIAFLAIVSFPFLWFGYVFLNDRLTGGIEHHGSYDEVNLKEMGNFPFDQSNGATDSVPARWRGLDGKRVMLEGFMWARGSAAPEINDFQFVYSITKCCFNGPPLVQERVFAHTANGARVPYYGDLVRIVGTLHVKVEKEAGIVTSVYTMDVDKLERT
jgi:hypothetical protein